MGQKFFKKRVIVALALGVSMMAAYGWYIRQFAVLPEPAYLLLQNVPGPIAQDKILVISPHPDDETLGAAGFMKRALDNRATVKVVIATDGNKHGLKTIRHQEAERALAILGVPSQNILFFDYPDAELKQFTNAFEKRLSELILVEKPTIILSTHPADSHPDHRVVGQVVNRLVDKLSSQPVVYQYLVHYHRYPRPEGFRPKSYLLPPVRLISVANPWQRFDLSLDEQTAKNEAVLQYKSQLKPRNPILRELLLSFIRQNELFVVVQHPRR